MLAPEHAESVVKLVREKNNGKRILALHYPALCNATVIYTATNYQHSYQHAVYM